MSSDSGVVPLEVGVSFFHDLLSDRVGGDRVGVVSQEGLHDLRLDRLGGGGVGRAGVVSKEDEVSRFFSLHDSPSERVGRGGVDDELLVSERMKDDDDDEV